ncbi:MAG: hypothetical protein WBA97_19195 [Actinophytocola sp.]|uniref:hypothetical protein n=1 Tax=Actinophytocola sp. TaxID=1872138 RepID=UPI003C771E12
MTQRPTEPHTMSSSRRRSAWSWTIAGAVVVVAAVVTLLLTTDDTTSDDQSAPATSTTTVSDGDHDLSTPQAAAESFAAAAEKGSGDALLALACVGRETCVREHPAEAGDTQLAEAQATIRDGVYELAEHLKGAEFTTAVDGTEPGTKDVPYRTPAMTGDTYLTLTFVQSEGDWLYYGPAT